MSANRKQRRRVVDHLQALRIAGFADGDERDAQFLRGFDLLLGCFARKYLRRSPTTAPRQRGQRLERGAGAAEVIDERAKRPRSDVLTADETQPVEPLLVGQSDGFGAFVHSPPLWFRQSCLAV